METKSTYTEKRILELADNMAAAAASFNCHGYDNFINAREELRIALRALKQYREEKDDKLVTLV